MSSLFISFLCVLLAATRAADASNVTSNATNSSTGGNVTYTSNTTTSTTATLHAPVFTSVTQAPAYEYNSRGYKYNPSIQRNLSVCLLVPDASTFALSSGALTARLQAATHTIFALSYYAPLMRHLANFTLVPLWGNSTTVAKSAILSLLTTTGKACHVLLGPGGSELIAMGIAPFVPALWIDYLLASDTMSDATTYTKYNRVTASDLLAAGAVFSFTQLMGWGKDVAMISASSSTAQAQNVQTAAATMWSSSISQSLLIPDEDTSVETITSLLRSLHADPTAPSPRVVIVALASGATLNAFINAAVVNDLSRTFIFIFTSPDTCMSNPESTWLLLPGSFCITQTEAGSPFPPEVVAHSLPGLEFNQTTRVLPVANFTLTKYLNLIYASFSPEQGATIVNTSALWYGDTFEAYADAYRNRNLSSEVEIFLAAGMPLSDDYLEEARHITRAPSLSGHDAVITMLNALHESWIPDAWNATTNFTSGPPPRITSSAEMMTALRASVTSRSYHGAMRFGDNAAAGNRQARSMLIWNAAPDGTARAIYAVPMLANSSNAFAYNHDNGTWALPNASGIDPARAYRVRFIHTPYWLDTYSPVPPLGFAPPSFDPPNVAEYIGAIIGIICGLCVVVVAVVAAPQARQDAQLLMLSDFAMTSNSRRKRAGFAKSSGAAWGPKGLLPKASRSGSGGSTSGRKTTDSAGSWSAGGERKQQQQQDRDGGVPDVMSASTGRPARFQATIGSPNSRLPITHGSVAVQHGGGCSSPGGLGLTSASADYGTQGGPAFSLDGSAMIDFVMPSGVNTRQSPTSGSGAPPEHNDPSIHRPISPRQRALFASPVVRGTALRGAAGVTNPLAGRPVSPSGLASSSSPPHPPAHHGAAPLSLSDGLASPSDMPDGPHSFSASLRLKPPRSISFARTQQQQQQQQRLGSGGVAMQRSNSSAAMGAHVTSADEVPHGRGGGNSPSSGGGLLSSDGGQPFVPTSVIAPAMFRADLGVSSDSSAMLPSGADSGDTNRRQGQPAGRHTALSTGAAGSATNPLQLRAVGESVVYTDGAIVVDTCLNPGVPLRPTGSHHSLLAARGGTALFPTAAGASEADLRRASGGGNQSGSVRFGMNGFGAATTSGVFGAPLLRDSSQGGILVRAPSRDGNNPTPGIVIDLSRSPLRLQSALKNADSGAMASEEEIHPVVAIPDDNAAPSSSSWFGAMCCFTPAAIVDGGNLQADNSSSAADGCDFCGLPRALGAWLAVLRRSEALAFVCSVTIVYASILLKVGFVWALSLEPNSTSAPQWRTLLSVLGVLGAVAAHVEIGQRLRYLWNAARTSAAARMSLEGHTYWQGRIRQHAIMTVGFLDIPSLVVTVVALRSLMSDRSAGVLWGTLHSTELGLASIVASAVVVGERMSAMPAVALHWVVAVQRRAERRRAAERTRLQREQETLKQILEADAAARRGGRMHPQGDLGGGAAFSRSVVSPAWRVTRQSSMSATIRGGRTSPVSSPVRSGSRQFPSGDGSGIFVAGAASQTLLLGNSSAFEAGAQVGLDDNKSSMTTSVVDFPRNPRVARAQRQLQVQRLAVRIERMLVKDYGVTLEEFDRVVCKAVLEITNRRHQARRRFIAAGRAVQAANRLITLCAASRDARLARGEMQLFYGAYPAGPNGEMMIGFSGNSISGGGDSGQSIVSGSQQSHSAVPHATVLAGGEAGGLPPLIVTDAYHQYHANHNGGAVSASHFHQVLAQQQQQLQQQQQQLALPPQQQQQQSWSAADLAEVQRLCATNPLMRSMLAPMLAQFATTMQQQPQQQQAVGGESIPLAPVVAGVVVDNGPTQQRQQLEAHHHRLQQQQQQQQLQYTHVNTSSMANRAPPVDGLHAESTNVPRTSAQVDSSAPGSPLMEMFSHGNPDPKTPMRHGSSSTLKGGAASTLAGSTAHPPAHAGPGGSITNANAILSASAFWYPSSLANPAASVPAPSGLSLSAASGPLGGAVSAGATSIPPPGLSPSADGAGVASGHTAGPPHVGAQLPPPAHRSGSSATLRASTQTLPPLQRSGATLAAAVGPHSYSVNGASAGVSAEGHSVRPTESATPPAVRGYPVAVATAATPLTPPTPPAAPAGGGGDDDTTTDSPALPVTAAGHRPPMAFPSAPPAPTAQISHLPTPQQLAKFAPAGHMMPSDLFGPDGGVSSPLSPAHAHRVAAPARASPGVGGGGFGSPPPGAVVRPASAPLQRPTLLLPPTAEGRQPHNAHALADFSPRDSSLQRAGFSGSGISLQHNHAAAAAAAAVAAHGTMFSPPPSTHPSASQLILPASAGGALSLQGSMNIPQAQSLPPVVVRAVVENAGSSSATDVGVAAPPGGGLNNSNGPHNHSGGASGGSAVLLQSPMTDARTDASFTSSRHYAHTQPPQSRPGTAPGSGTTSSTGQSHTSSGQVTGSATTDATGHKESALTGLGTSGGDSPRGHSGRQSSQMLASGPGSSTLLRGNVPPDGAGSKSGVIGGVGAASASGGPSSTVFHSPLSTRGDSTYSFANNGVPNQQEQIAAGGHFDPPSNNSPPSTAAAAAPVQVIAPAMHPAAAPAGAYATPHRSGSGNGGRPPLSGSGLAAVTAGGGGAAAASVASGGSSTTTGSSSSPSRTNQQPSQAVAATPPTVASDMRQQFASGASANGAGGAVGHSSGSPYPSGATASPDDTVGRTKHHENLGGTQPVLVSQASGIPPPAPALPTARVLQLPLPHEPDRTPVIMPPSNSDAAKNSDDDGGSPLLPTVMGV